MTDPIFQAVLASARPIGADFACGACGLPPEHELHTQTTFGEYHEFDWIRKEIRALVSRGDITVEENEAIACNSYERELMVPALTDEAFMKQMQHAIANCFTTRERPFSTYNQAVEGLYAPELLRRYKEAVEPELKYERLMRTPDGHINNCSLANGDVESNCQICLGTCPDRERYTGGLGVK